VQETRVRSATIEIEKKEGEIDHLSSVLCEETEAAERLKGKLNNLSAKAKNNAMRLMSNVVKGFSNGELRVALNEMRTGWKERKTVETSLAMDRLEQGVQRRALKVFSNFVKELEGGAQRACIATWKQETSFYLQNKALVALDEAMQSKEEGLAVKILTRAVRNMEGGELRVSLSKWRLNSIEATGGLKDKDVEAAKAELAAYMAECVKKDAARDKKEREMRSAFEQEMQQQHFNTVTKRTALMLREVFRTWGDGDLRLCFADMKANYEWDKQMRFQENVKLESAKMRASMEEQFGQVLTNKAERILQGFMKRLNGGEVRVAMGQWKKNRYEDMYDKALREANERLAANITARAKIIVGSVMVDLLKGSLRGCFRDFARNYYDMMRGKDEAAVDDLTAALVAKNRQERSLMTELEDSLAKMAGKDKAAQAKAISMLSRVFARMEGGEVRVAFADMKRAATAYKEMMRDNSTNGKLVQMFELAEKRAGVQSAEIARLKALIATMKEEWTQEIERLATMGTTTVEERHRRNISEQLRRAGGDTSLAEESPYGALNTLECTDEIFRVKAAAGDILQEAERTIATAEEEMKTKLREKDEIIRELRNQKINNVQSSPTKGKERKLIKPQNRNANFVPTSENIVLTPKSANTTRIGAKSSVNDSQLCPSHRAEVMFDEIDVNGDGVIVREEWENAKAAWKAAIGGSRDAPLTASLPGYRGITDDMALAHRNREIFPSEQSLCDFHKSQQQPREDISRCRTCHNLNIACTCKDPMAVAAELHKQISGGYRY